MGAADMKSIKKANASYQFLPLQNACKRIYRMFLIFPFIIGGCAGASPPSHMPALLEQEPRPNSVMQGIISETPGQRLPVGLALVPDVQKTESLTPLSEGALTRFTVITKSKLESTIPLDIQEVVRLERFQRGKGVEELKGLSKDDQVDFVILILTSSEEVKTPAYLDASAPDVGILPGNEIENYALVEVALVDIRSGRSLIQAHGRSHARLEQLDVPIESNRYPLVQGSAHTNRYFPSDDMAIDVLRTVALEEALDQALMQFDTEWRATVSASANQRS